MIGYEDGRENLEKLKGWYEAYPSDRNEATTRLSLIDQLLTDCLGWDRSDIVAEDHSRDGYADYALNAPNKASILEAKREGDYFELPLGTKSLIQKLPGLMRDNEGLEKALVQVSGYCQSRGVPIGAVCNGHQLVIFIATRVDGVEPLDGNAFAFDSFDSMLTNFRDLWNAFSKLGIENKYAQNKLAGTDLPTIPAKLSATILHYPGNRRRNSLQVDLQNVAELVLEDLVKGEMEKRFLEDCYCTSGALSRYSLISRDILKDRYAAFLNETTKKPHMERAVSKKGTSTDLLSESLARRPILLLGDVGVGKSTFIKHLIKVEAADYFKTNIALYVNLGSKAVLADDMRNAITGELTRILIEEYSIDIDQDQFVRAVYGDELKRFESGIFGPLKEANPSAFIEREIEYLGEKVSLRDEHLKHSLMHVVSKSKRQIAIFLDNTDQRNPNDQQTAFLIAQEIAENWDATVFLSIRPETYHLSIKEGALSGYHTKAFTIDPPRIDKVLEKRLAFASKIARGEIRISGLGEEFGVKLVRLDTMLSVLIRSLQNKELMEFIDNLSYGNVRQALEMVKQFLGSGHVDTEKILSVEESGEEYIIPLHEFLRAIIYGDGMYFDPNRSLVVNILDISRPDSKEHFLLPEMISLLISLSKSGNAGFVEQSVLYAKLQTLGYTPEQIDTGLSRAIRSKLIEVSGSYDLKLRPEEKAFRVAPSGVYHNVVLLPKFAYLDAVVLDTPILHQVSRNMTKDVHSIMERVQRADYFVEYLNAEWQNNNQEKGQFNWGSTYSSIQGELKRVKDSVERAEGNKTKLPNA